MPVGLQVQEDASGGRSVHEGTALGGGKGQGLPLGPLRQPCMDLVQDLRVCSGGEQRGWRSSGGEHRG